METDGFEEIIDAIPTHRDGVAYEMLQPISVILRFREEEPHFLRFIFPQDVHWDIGRELIQAGVKGEEEGVGSVRMKAMGAHLAMFFVNKDESARFLFPRRQVARFLRFTYSIVPRMNEFHADRIDQMIMKILQAAEGQES